MQKSNFMPQFILDMKLQSWAKYYKQIHKIIAFSMEYFTAAFLQFSSANVRICLLGDRLDNSPQFHVLHRFLLLKFPDFLRF